MHVLSANSQNVEGEEIDSLCLEEPFRNASSGVIIWNPPLDSGESHSQGAQESGRQTHWSLGSFLTGMLSSCGDSPMPREPTIKSESSVVLGTREEIQVKAHILMVHYAKSYAGAFQISLLVNNLCSMIMLIFKVNCAPQICIILLTSVTPIYLIKGKK